MKLDLDQFAPKYRQIAGRLHQRIRDRRYRSDQPLPTEAALMREFGCSRSTVREALDVLVSAKVLTRHQGKGTFLNIDSPGIRKSTLIFSYPSAASLQHPFLGRLFAAFEQGVESYSRQLDREISVQCIRQAKIEGTRYFTLLHAEDPLQMHIVDPNHVQGVCLTCSVREDEYVEIQKRGIRCIAIGGPGLTKAPSVYFDSKQQFDPILRHLKQLGHRDIGLVGAELWMDGDPSVYCQSFMDAMRQHGLTVHPSWVAACGEFDRVPAKEAALAPLGSPRRPTAVVCEDDFIALGVRDAAESLGLGVPDDLTIIGTGDYLIDSNLTSLRIPLVQMGKAAAVNLCRMAFEQGSSADARQEVNQFELMVRQTSGSAPS